MKEGLLTNKSDAIFIPETDNQLKLRIVIAGHAGMCGHRGFTQRKSV